MSDFKAMPCKSMPVREFIFDENRPNLVGVRTVGTGGRYWIGLKQADREIENHERQLKFWRELRGLFDGEKDNTWPEEDKGKTTP